MVSLRVLDSKVLGIDIRFEVFFLFVLFLFLFLFCFVLFCFVLFCFCFVFCFVFLFFVCLFVCFFFLIRRQNDDCNVKNFKRFLFGMSHDVLEFKVRVYTCTSDFKF